MSYMKWFIKEGWKSYWFSFGILLLIDVELIIHRPNIFDMPVLGIIIAVTSIIGANIGLPYHSFVTWKASQNPNP